MRLLVAARQIARKAVRPRFTAGDATAPSSQTGERGRAQRGGIGLRKARMARCELALTVAQLGSGAAVGQTPPGAVWASNDARLSKPYGQTNRLLHGRPRRAECGHSDLPLTPICFRWGQFNSAPARHFQPIVIALVVAFASNGERATIVTPLVSYKVISRKSPSVGASVAVTRVR